MVKLRGHGYDRAVEIIKYEETSVGLEEKIVAEKEEVRWFVEKIMGLDEEFANTD